MCVAPKEIVEETQVLVLRPFNLVQEQARGRVVL